MSLCYCEECSRVFKESEKCPYCQGEGVMLKKNAPVNVIGTKIKGRVFKETEDNVVLIIRTEDNSKVMKEHLPSNLRKIL